MGSRNVNKGLSKLLKYLVLILGKYQIIRNIVN